MSSRFLDTLRSRVLLCDGAIGTLIQARDWDVEKDFLGRENCSEILNLTLPDYVEATHVAYFEAGADCVETNTFGANQVVLAEFDLAERTREINRRAAEIAVGVARRYATPDRPRFVIGAVGPGTKLASLDHTTYDILEASYAEQARGLIDGGVDVFLCETNQDLLTVKAAVNGIKLALEEAGRASGDDRIPIFVQITIETTGTMLVGSDIASATVAIDALDVDGIGLNCATGPAEMAEHIRWLGEHWRRFISVMPNAGLPMLVDGKTEYPLLPRELSDWHARFLADDGINLVGGCCGTTPEHIREVRKMLDALEAKQGHLRPKVRTPEWTPAVSSLYTAYDLRQENALFAVGERSNANGSKLFRDKLGVEDWDALTAIGRDQVKEGSHAIDVCCAYVGRPEARDMTEVIKRYRGQVAVPLVIDSTELPVLETALKLIGGKAIINSINFEDGEEKADKVLRLAKKFGAAVIALTIDEQGMAKSADDKLRVAHRLYDFAVNKHGLPPSDLLFDPLTFTICTGVEDDRGHGIGTLDAIARITEELPECQTLLGLSNISFGLNPAARHVLNSVFLAHAQKRGLTAAIIHVSKIVPLHKIPVEEKLAAENLIFNDWKDGKDPLLAYVDLFKDKTLAQTVKVRADTIEEVLKNRIVDGDKPGLADDLATAMKTHKPLAIINDILLDGMKVVGELFASGEMQLPFVLQSAETMKAAVAYLEKFMERVAGQEKGIMVIATVKGDVHDIGKNLVDIILTNNGYKVINLGIKQPLEHILKAADEHNADAIGMSGLLVKSTVIMKDNLAEMKKSGRTIPVILGGAALTRRFVETDCRDAYTEPLNVHYAKDAFAGLRLMDQIVTAKPALAAA
ncbi:MAG: homocysteine S-methyltransferase family protein [Betaproteobacteria bacterium]|nr:homocysteine S-methyltransferase family protein [Betaproteobacteria bacterium]